MKSKTILAIIAVVILIVTGTIFFFWQRGPHLPHAQMPQAPGTFILENQAVFAGYKTPEAALESYFWACIHEDYDAAVASFPPNKQAEMRKELGNPKHFKSEARREISQLKGVEIMARKNMSGDRVELKFQVIDSGGVHNKGETNLVIIPAVKIGKEWKLNMESVSGYQTNWENSGDVVTFAE